MKILRFLCCCFLATLAPALLASTTPGSSPYFLIEGTDAPSEANPEHFPLKSTVAEVTISGVIADVTLTQRYANSGERPIDAVYIFPGSTGAAVYGMEVQIGERTTVAQIKEKEQAKQDYEEAKAQKKNAALLEQQRPNVFQMSVANILPGDEVEVVLRYTEYLYPENREYSFVFPGVVGPRYTDGTSAPAGDVADWVANPYLKEGAPAPAAFDLTVRLNGGLPLGEIACPTHAVAIEYTDRASATVSLRPEERKQAADRDYILRYKLAGEQVAGGLLLHRADDGGENFFLLNVQPPARITPEAIVPREYLFVVDVSGSMNGFPLNTAKTLMRDLLSSLRPGERFNVLLFAASARTLDGGMLDATPDNIDRATTFLDSAKGGGGTKLLDALERAFDLPVDDTVARSTVVVTDGFVDVEREAFQLIRDRREDANVFALGIGSSVNRYLIEGIAKAGGGEAFVVTEPGQSTGATARLRNMIDAPVLAGATIEIEGLDAYDIEPTHVGDLLAERPITVTGKWRGEPAGRIILSGTRGDGSHYEEILPIGGAENASNPALPRLWARERIDALASDYALDKNGEAKQAITNLGLTYSLLTEFTSFIAVSDEAREFAGEAQAVKQPLPLPKGVGNSAVASATPSSNVSTVPEPGVPLLVLITLATLAFTRHRR